MMKNILALIFLTLSTSAAFAQSVTGVSTTAENKNAIMEEFSGVRCGNCPAGHQVIATLVATYGNDYFVTSLHPTNSNYTTPYTGDPDFRNGFNDAFYSTPYCGTSRFMPSAFINRRKGWSTAGERISSRSNWTNAVATMITEPSPMNVGVEAKYDMATSMLNLTVEVYYTSAVTDANTLYVMMNEDSLFSQQSGATGIYEQSHLMREAFTAQWGDAIATTTSGQMQTWTYQFDNSVKNYNMTACDVVAYVYSDVTGEIYTGYGNDVTFGPMTAIADEKANMNLQVYPNPFTDQARVVFTLETTTEVNIYIHNLIGQKVYTADVQNIGAGTNTVELNANEAGLESGIYFLTIEAGDVTDTRKLIVK